MTRQQAQALARFYLETLAGEPVNLQDATEYPQRERQLFHIRFALRQDRHHQITVAVSAQPGSEDQPLGADQVQIGVFSEWDT